MENLRKVVTQYTSVKRNGHETEIETSNLVPGDIVVLKAGDKIPEWKSVVNFSKLVPFLAPVVILVFLLFKGLALITCGFYASIEVVIFYIFSDFNFIEINRRISQLPSALSKGGKSVLVIIPKISF